MVVRYVGTGLVVLSLLLSIINPILGVVLILVLGFGTNLGLRILVKVSFRNIAFYLTYVGFLCILGGLWFFSVITTVEAAIIFVIFVVGYWVVSTARGGLWPS